MTLSFSPDLFINIQLSI